MSEYFKFQKYVKSLSLSHLFSLPYFFSLFLDDMYF